MNQDSNIYIQKDLKRGVDYIGVTCVFYCHDGKGNILLHKRSDKCRDEIGKWDCGGGAMEHGETFEQSAKREIKEEYGCEVLDLKFIQPVNVLRKNHLDQNTHWIAMLFVAQLDPQKTIIGDPVKMDEMGWFPINNLPYPLHSMFESHFEYIKKSGFSFS